MNPYNLIINKYFPDNQVILKLDDIRQWYFVFLWTAKANKTYQLLSKEEVQSKAYLLWEENNKNNYYE